MHPDYDERDSFGLGLELLRDEIFALRRRLTALSDLTANDEERHACHDPILNIESKAGVFGLLNTKVGEATILVGDVEAVYRVLSRD